MVTFRSSDTTAVCVTLAAAALLFTFDPVTTWWFPSCPFYVWTGWLCPFCGSLRALHALLSGDLRVALELNPLTIVGLAAGLVAFAHDVTYPTRPTGLERLTALWFSARGFALAVAFAVFRNLPESFHQIVY